MEDVLSQMSFDEGIAMPVANEENKRLEQELDKKQRDLGRLRDDVELFSERIHSMTDHLKNVRQELQHTQEICNARKRETDTELHMKQVAEREFGRLRNESRRIQKELDELKERRNVYENNIFKGTEKLDELKQQMKWDQQALDAWLQECDAKDEDALTLQRYTRADESKVKELSLKQAKLVDDRVVKRKALEHEITTTLTSQLELDKTAEAFRAAHMDRQQLLMQWEGTIQQMQRRDKEMDQASLRLAELRIELRNRENTEKEKQQFLDSELLNNKEKEKKISSAERTAAKLHLEYQTMENARIQFQDELETLKFTVDRTAKDLESTREKVIRLKREVVDKQDKYKSAQNDREDLQEQLKMITDSTLSAEDRARRLEEMLKNEEYRIHDVEKELHRLREMQFKRTQELYQIKQMETNIGAEIQGARAASRNLTSKLHKLDQDSLKQQEIVYNQNFQLQQLERKISRLQGERSSDEKSQLEARIKDLTVILDNQTLEHGLLTTQLKKLNDDLRRANRDLNNGSEEQGALTSKIEELHLHNDSSERELRKIVGEKQDLMVEENILKLEVKRLRDRLNYRADGVLSLANRRLELETSMKQRRHEIKIHMDMLKAQMKATEEERQTVSTELHERIAKIDKLRKRYEILMVSMAPPEGEEDKSQAYYVIKAAQEKEELQRTGDELDAKIRKAEKEIRALENTLRLMNTKNETYRKSFSKVEQTSEEFEEKQQLEENLRAVMDKYKYKRRQIKELQEDLETMSSTMEELNQEEQDLVSSVEEKQSKITSLQKEISDQELKHERVNKQLSRLIRDIRSAKGTKDEIPEERDVDIRELRAFNSSIMNQLGEINHNYPEVTNSVQLYFSQAGLPMPPSPTSISGSRPPSSRSSRSSLASVRSTSTSRSVSEGRSGIITASVNIGSEAFAGVASPKGTSPTKTPSRGSSSKGSPTKRTSSRPGSASSQGSKTSSRGSARSKK